MISTIMQESKYIADTVEQKYVVESGKAFKVGVFWACSRDLARDIPNNLQEIKKKKLKRWWKLFNKNIPYSQIHYC